MTTDKCDTDTSYLRHLSFFFSSRRRHTRCSRDWSSDVCSSDLDSRLGQSLRVSSKRALVDGLGLLADAPCFVQALLKLAARGGDAVVERQVAGRDRKSVV